MTTEHPHSATPESGHDRDAVLLHALRHAPEPAHAPSDAVRAHVLAHASKSIAKNPINKSDNAEKMPENGWRWLVRRCSAALGLHPQRWVWAPLTGGAVASLMVAVLVGLLWHDDGRREQGMQDSVVAAASAPHQGAASTTAPVPAKQELAKAPASAPQSQALASESAAKMAPSTSQAQQAMPIPAPALAPESMAARKQREERTASIEDRRGDADSGSKMATAPSALPPSATAPSAAPPSHVATARASASAPELEADAGFSAAQPSASTRAEQSTARSRQGLSAPETLPPPAPLVPKIADTAKAEITPAPAVASARAPELTADSQPAPKPVSALVALDQLLLSAGKTRLQCSTPPAIASTNQPAQQVEKNCNTSAAHILLGSQLLRSVLRRAVVHAGTDLPSDTRYVEWYLPAGSPQPAATLGWSPTQRLLYWRTPDAQYSALVNLQQDAASMQKLVNAVVGVGDAEP